MKDILTAITELREQRNWTEYQLAERSGLPPVSYTHLDVYKRQEACHTASAHHPKVYPDPSQTD